MQKKMTSTVEYFKPYPFVLKKDRRHGITVDSSPINWSKLSDSEFESQWSYCLNRMWSYEKEGVISKEYLMPYLTKFMKDNGYTAEQIKQYESAPDWMNSVAMLNVAYLLVNVYNKPSSFKWLSDKINHVISTVKPIVKEAAVAEKPKRNIQDAMREKLSDIIGEIHGMEDDTDYKTKPDFLKWFTNQNVAKVYMDSIESKFKRIVEELEVVLEGKDEQLKEGYSSYSKSDIKKRIEWFNHLLTDVDAYRRQKMSTRKIRTRKPKPPAKLVAKLKYLSYSDDHKIQSVNAEKIVGADTLWVYNQKYRRLIVYIASDMDKELSVKGSTITGWDPKASYGKTLRKPDEQLKSLISGGKVAMRNLLKDIKGKAKTVNGRINRDCILLKVF